jgi:tetratricopeptide (TPR) repeat protein
MPDAIASNERCRVMCVDGPLTATMAASDSSPKPAAQARPRETASALRGRWWRRCAAIVAGLIAAGLLASFAWSEFHPAVLAEAEAAYRRNDLESALRIAQAHLARRPFSRQAALLAARCLSRLGRLDQAEPYYRKAEPLDLTDQHVRAYALVLSNRREPAIQAYRELLARSPNDVLALSRMAAVQISESRWQDTLDTSGRLIKIPEGEVIGQTLAGVVHHNTHDYEFAVLAFDRVLELDPNLERMPLKPRSMFWIDYAHDLLEVGRYADARRHLQRVLAEAPDAKVADLLGQSYYLEGALDDAERYWRLALQWDAGRFGTWWRIGQLELKRGRSAEAIEPLRRASAIEPAAAGPLYSLSLAYRRLGRTEESDRLMAEVDRLRRAPGSKVEGGREDPQVESGEKAR